MSLPTDRLERLITEERGGCSEAGVDDRLDSLRSYRSETPPDAGLVTRRKDGALRYYERTDRAEVLLTALDETRGSDR